MSNQKILLELRGGVATLTFNRPDRDNAVDPEMMAALLKTLSDVNGGGLAKVLLLRGNGAHFCTGRQPGPQPPKDTKGWRETLGQITRVNRLLTSFPGMVMALVHGKAFGFGCGMAVQSDFTLAADNARFAFPEVKAGLPPTIVMSYLGRLIPRKKAFELVITAKEMDAYEAERLGLVNRVVPADQLSVEGERWASFFLAQDAEVVKTCKAFFRETADIGSEDAARYGISLLANFMSDRSRR